MATSLVILQEDYSARKFYKYLVFCPLEISWYHPRRAFKLDDMLVAHTSASTFKAHASCLFR